MSARRSTVVFLVFGTLGTAFAACLIDGSTPRQGELDPAQSLVRDLGLSDLALFTEARYTRNPTQADLHSAFQDHPLALEHFRSGSLIPPRHESLARETAAPD
jgi:hypothetical protein